MVLGDEDDNDNDNSYRTLTVLSALHINSLNSHKNPKVDVNIKEFICGQTPSKVWIGGLKSTNALCYPASASDHPRIF